MALVVWRREGDGRAERVVAREPVALSTNTVPPLPVNVQLLGDVAVLAETRDTPGMVGALLVPDALHGVVRSDGVPLRSGLHLVRHGGELTVGSQTLWVAESRAADEVLYDPLVHGDGVSCYLTHSPFVDGEPIVVCPGTSASECGRLFRAPAWQTALGPGSRLSCPNCGFRPVSNEWTPPSANEETRLQALLNFEGEEGEKA